MSATPGDLLKTAMTLIQKALTLMAEHPRTGAPAEFWVHNPDNLENLLFSDPLTIKEIEAIFPNAQYMLKPFYPKGSR